jgi:hypothetical protein
VSWVSGATRVPDGKRTRRLENGPARLLYAGSGLTLSVRYATMMKTFGVAARVLCLSSVLVWACGEAHTPLAALAADAGANAGAAGSATLAGEGGMAGAAPSGAGATTAESCSPGTSRACQVDLLCSGEQTCTADGSGFSECDCGSVPLGGTALVGSKCESDADCRGGGTCLRADGNLYLGAGGPAGGYCTFSCSAADDDCASHDLQSFCVGLGPEGAEYCIRRCLSKDAEPGEAKCLNRTDLACVSVAADGAVPFAAERQEGYCAPRCASDSECPSGRVCHRQAGICTSAPAPGAPAGSRCRLTTECDGKMCEDIVNGVGVCTSLCVLGSLAGCGYEQDSESRGAACLIPLVAAGRFSEAAGDLGLCRELCDVPADCRRADEGWECRPLSAAASAFVGRVGACSPPG